MQLNTMVPFIIKKFFEGKFFDDYIIVNAHASLWDIGGL